MSKLVLPNINSEDPIRWTGDVSPLECIDIKDETHNVKSFTFKSKKGYKQSGSLSRDQGTEALNSFLQTKTIWISHT